MSEEVHHRDDEEDTKPPPIPLDFPVSQMTAGQLKRVIIAANQPRFGQVFMFWLMSIPVVILFSLAISCVTCGGVAGLTGRDAGTSRR